MSPWKTLIVVAALGLSAAPPASADEGLGLGTEVAGFVISTSASLVDGGAADVGTEEVVGKCTYVGVTGINGIRYAFGGAVASYATNGRVPIYSEITCILISEKRPGDIVDTLTASIGTGCSVAACATGNTTPLLIEWPQRQVIICVSGQARFGPLNPIFKPIPPRCSERAI